MNRRHSSFSATVARPKLALALPAVLRSGYDSRAFRSDALAGLVVAIVALPLSMALAIAVGVAPQHGLYTAIVAGATVALLGGSRYQITGPTAAFIVILAPIASRYGLAGLLTAGFLSGAMLLAMGLSGLGRLIEFIPYPVTTGFTAGIACVIFVLQWKDGLGLRTGPLPDHFPEKVAALIRARHTVSGFECGISALTLGALFGVPRLTKRIPAPLVAITLAALAALLLKQLLPSAHIETVGTRFQSVVDGKLVAGIPREVPLPSLPWGSGLPTLALIRELLPAAFAIAVLSAIESLLSAVIADGMTGTRHDPNAELVALGVGNLLCPLFGGIAATGALARTATNVRSGAVSPLSAALHAAFLLLFVLLFAPLVAYVPMAALAALLMLVAWNMSELRHAMHMLRVAPRGDVLVLLSCFSLTVLFDMVIAVSFGVLLAALLFMRRMAELTSTRVLEGAGDAGRDRSGLPQRVAVYEIRGPLFFGAAQRGVAQLDALRADVRVVVLDLSRVPIIDASGLVALESALERLQRTKRFVILGGPLPEPKSVFERAELERHHGNIVVADSPEEAVDMARALVLLNPEWGAPLQVPSSHPYPQAPAVGPSDPQTR